MLIKLLPEQIAKVWDIIRFGVVRSVAFDKEIEVEMLQGLLHSLLLETSQCWLGVVEQEEDMEKRFYAFAITKIVVDEVTQERNLNIAHIYGFRPMEDDLWMQGVEAFKAFAKVNRCKYVTAISANKRILEMAQKMKFKETILLSLEV